MNYDQRMQAYKKDCQDFWLKEFSVVGAVGVVVISGLMLGASKLPGFQPPFDLDWRQLALLIWIASMIMPIKMMHPERPEPGDVLRDQALRRSAGMGDSVDE